MDFKEYIINQLKKAVEKDLLQIIYNRPFTSSGAWEGYCGEGVKVDFFTSTRLLTFLRKNTGVIEGFYRGVSYSFTIDSTPYSDRMVSVHVSTWPQLAKRDCYSEISYKAKNLPIKEQISRVFGGQDAKTLGHINR